MPSPVVIDVELSTSLTTSICSHLAIELIKHIAYQRQQIPFPYKQLVTVLNNCGYGARIENQSTQHTAHDTALSFYNIQAQNEFTKVKGLLESMQTTFQNLEQELQCEHGIIEEIAMVLGATPLSPRDVFRLQFPPLLHGHLESKHPHQSSLLALFRCLISSEEFNSIVNQPLSPTNMHLFLRKNNTYLATSGFVCMERYDIPSSGKHVIIRLLPPVAPPQCICGGANIYKDFESESVQSKNSEETDQLDVNRWFQAHVTLKGFKDIKINGVFASTVWLQSK